MKEGGKFKLNLFKPFYKEKYEKVNLFCFSFLNNIVMFIQEKQFPSPQQFIHHEYFGEEMDEKVYIDRQTDI